MPKDAPEAKSTAQTSAPVPSQSEMMERAVRETAISKVANWIAGAIFFVPILIIWVAFFYLSTKSTWLVNMSPSARGILIVGIVTVLLILGKVFIVKVAPLIDKKLKK